ncbi:MAG: CarD family transcriptional regulator [Chloroflexota bacterium]
MTFESGDPVVHARYGAGQVTGVRVLDQDGEDKRYFCIELVDDRGTLMIREGKVSNDELRPALTDTRMIDEILRKEPQALSSNHRSRQGKLDKMIKSGNPRCVAQALRDLAWREATHRLTAADIRLKGEAIKKLADELALNPRLSMIEVRRRLAQLIDRAMDYHQSRQSVAVL